MVVKRKSPVIVNLLESMEFNFVQRLEKNRLFYILHSTIIVLSVCAFIAEESPEMEFVAARYWYHLRTHTVVLVVSCPCWSVCVCDTPCCGVPAQGDAGGSLHAAVHARGYHSLLGVAPEQPELLG